MLLGPNFCPKEELLLFTSPGITTSCGPIFAAFVYSTPLSSDLSAAAFARCDTPLPAVGDGFDSLTQVGGVCAARYGEHVSASKSGASLIRLSQFRSIPLCGMFAANELRAVGVATIIIVQLRNQRVSLLPNEGKS